MNRPTNDFNNKDMAKKLRAIRLIQELHTEMEAHWQLPEMFQLILRFLHDVFGFEYSMIYLLDSDADILSFQAGWGLPEGYSIAPIKLGQGYIGTSAKSGEILRIGNMRSAFLYSRALRKRLESSIYKEQLGEPVFVPEFSPIQSQMSVPLKIKSTVIGIIVVESVRSNAFDELDQELLLLLAGQTAQLIEKVQRADQDRIQDEALFHAIGHLQRLIEYLNTVTSLTSLQDASTYASAIAKQLQGLMHADTDIAQAKQYFEEAADAFVELHLPLDVARSRLGWAMLDSIQRPVVAVQAMKQCLDIFSQFDDSSYTFFTNSLSDQIQSIEVPQEPSRSN